MPFGASDQVESAVKLLFSRDDCYGDIVNADVANALLNDWVPSL